jgi:hypothetical protein
MEGINLFQNSKSQGETQSVEQVLWLVDHLPIIRGNMPFDVFRYCENRRRVVAAFGLSRYF